MEHLRLRADRFRKQGRLQEDEMEAIIKEMREEMVGKEGGDQASDTARAEEYKRVMEAVKCKHMASLPTASRLGSSGHCARTPMG